jgi:hypothetical protein
MSIPSGVLRYAGIWNATDTYIPGIFVQSSIVNNSYAALTVVTGGSDPSIASPNWVEFPLPPSGDITSVSAGTGLSGGGSAGNVTLANAGVLSVGSGDGIAVSEGQNPSISNTGVISLGGLVGSVVFGSPNGSISFNNNGNTIEIQQVPTINNGIPYSLSGATANAVITNRDIGNLFPMTQNVFNLITTITFTLPSVLGATDGIYYDGWWFGDFFANFNSYWGVSYTTNTFATPTVLIGSITTTANAITISNVQQIYLPLNLIIPPTHLVGGGTITLKIYCNPTSINHYLTLAPVNTARIGIVID